MGNVYAVYIAIKTPFRLGAVAMADRVLVTGGSGFVAGYCIAELLAHGEQLTAHEAPLPNNGV